SAHRLCASRRRTFPGGRGIDERDFISLFQAFDGCAGLVFRMNLDRKLFKTRTLLQENCLRAFFPKQRLARDVEYVLLPSAQDDNLSGQARKKSRIRIPKFD